MIVVAHQAIGMRLPAGPLAGLSQGLYEVVPIHVIEENVVALIATAHDVIHRVRDTQREACAAWAISWEQWLWLSTLKAGRF
jgi:hypothetical protein